MSDGFNTSLGSSLVLSDSLVTAQASLSKLSHLLRTPLGVVKGAIDDLKNGYELTDEDILFASESIEQVVEMLDGVRIFGRRIDGYRPILVSLSDLCAEFDSLFVNKHCQLEIQDNSLDEVFFDETMMRMALHSLFSYAVLVLTRSLGSDQGKVKFSASMSNVSGTDLQLKIELENTSIPLAVDESLTFKELAQVDHSMESLGLLYLDEIAHSLNGATEVVQEEGTAIFCARFCS